ncbi:transient receptor potential cation channel subfamily M member 2-like, partial [Saccoglossus kowalevskii]
MVCMDTNMYKWFIPLLTAIYLMIANILLLNLLIAMFSYTFQNVQDNSKTIWRFFRCQVIIEYFERPTMVPPFILLNHVYRIVKFAYRKIKLKYDLRHHGNRSKQEIQNENDERQSHELKVCLNAKDEYKLNSFEMRCMEEYFIKLHQKDVQCIETTVLSNVGRLEGVIQQVQELREAADKDDIPMATEPASSCPTISTQKGQRDTEDKLLQFMSQINERLTKLEEDMKRL